MPGRNSPPIPLRSLDVVQQRVHERAAGVSGGGMHDHSRGLVHHDQVRILIGDVERDVLGGRFRGGWRGHVHDDRVARPHARVRAHGARAHLHQAVLDQSLDLRARVPWQHCGEESVEPLACVLLGDGELHP